MIAEVQGIATAAGCQLVATCDLAIASEEAAVRDARRWIGLFCTTPMVALSRAIGRKRALEMLLTGEPINARRPTNWGLVNRVVSAGMLREESLKLARRIAEASDMVVCLGKRLTAGRLMSISRGLAYAQDVMTRNAVTRDAQEGISAFLEKRNARWGGN